MTDLINGVSGAARAGHPAPVPASPGSPDSPGSLRRLTGQHAADFAKQIWSRQPLLTRAADLPASFADLLDADAVDELVSARGLRTPFLRVAKNGQTVPDRQFTAPGGVGAGINDQVSDDALTALFADGSTMVLQGLHRVWPPIIAFCQQLAAELGHPVQANAYVTPPQNQGFSDHYDVHDVFVLQIEGEKHWSIHAPVLTDPLRSQPWSDRRAAVEAGAATAPVIDAVLRPGDCLYLPRGYLHAAQALGGVSTHLTLGVHPWTRYALAEELTAAVLADLVQDPELRGSLPVGVDFGDDAPDLELVRDRVRAAVDRVGGDRVTGPLQRRARAAQRAAPVGPLRQLRLAETLTADTAVALRPHLAADTEPRAAGGLTLRSRGAAFVVTADEVAGLDLLLTGEPVPAGQVGVELVGRLVRAGLVVRAD